MPTLINLNRRARGKPARPTRSWTPKGKGDLELLHLLLSYGYLTRELLQYLVVHRHAGQYQRADGEVLGRTGGHIRNRLARLVKHGYVKRFWRPSDLGSSQFVFTITMAGARHLETYRLDQKERELDEAGITNEQQRVEEIESVYFLRRQNKEKPTPTELQIRNRLKAKKDFEHGLACNVFRMIWQLGAPSFAERLQTVAYWTDKGGEAGKADTWKNAFTVKLDGETYTLNPDATIWVAWQPPAGQEGGYYQPLHLELQRTHRNFKATVDRFRAYWQLLGGRGNLEEKHGETVKTVKLVNQQAVAAKVFRKHVVERNPAAGWVLFVTEDQRQRRRLMQAANKESVLPPQNSHSPTILFGNLYQREGDSLPDPVMPLMPKRQGREQLMEPHELFTKPIAVDRTGKPYILCPETDG